MNKVKPSVHELMQKSNNLLDRGALCMNVKFGEAIEFSNGTTVVIKKMNGRKISIVIVAPKNIVIYRPTERKSADDAE